MYINQLYLSITTNEFLSVSRVNSVFAESTKFSSTGRKVIKDFDRDDGGKGGK